MRTLLLPFRSRYVIYTLCLAATAALAALLSVRSDWIYLLIPLGLFGALSVRGTYDLLQPRHAILRNYPISAHLRFLLEAIRPELRQYFSRARRTGRRSAATPAP
jgi:hypothetical protein